MNIIDAYIKFKGQLLIYISGLPGCGKLELGKNISRDFKLDLINQRDYYIQDYDEKVALPDGTEVVNWCTDKAIDWDKLNADLIEKKKTGVVVVGISFPDTKLEVDADYHIHLNISKQVCAERRKEFLEKNKEEYSKEYELMGTPTEKLVMNQLIFPYYLEAIKKAKVNKFININELSDDQVYDNAFDVLISFIKQYLKQDEPEMEDETTPKVSHFTKSEGK